VVRRENLFALSGTVLGFGLCYGVLAIASVLRTQPSPGDVPTAEPSPVAAEADSSIDPAMLANANLSQSLSECSHQLVLVAEENVRLERQLEAENEAASDAGKSALARRIARRDLSLDDWKQMARTGTVKYVLPCASFSPSPEAMDGLGLEPNDVPVIRDAFVAARTVAWGQIRPLCASAVGNSNAADRLGLEACPQLILSSERTTNPNAAAAAMRAVAATRAGSLGPVRSADGGPRSHNLLRIDRGRERRRRPHRRAARPRRSAGRRVWDEWLRPHGGFSGAGAGAG
jgi:hypothetical protein